MLRMAKEFSRYNDYFIAKTKNKKEKSSKSSNKIQRSQRKLVRFHTPRRLLHVRIFSKRLKIKIKDIIEDKSEFRKGKGTSDAVGLIKINIFKYVFAPMGRFQLELIYLYFPPSFHQIVVVSVL